MKKQDVTQENVKRIRDGEIAERFLNSPEWLDLVKPIIDSMLIGLRDATTIDVSSDKKAAIEVKSRTIAASYLAEIETLIRGYIQDAQVVLTMENRKKNREQLSREVE